jgi:hypothetical protein
MRFYGNLIATVGGHSKNSPVIVDRTVEAYVTKTKVKMYLFESDYKYWHKNGHILDIVEVAINKRPIKDIVTEQINNLATKHEINFENFEEKLAGIK